MDIVIARHCILAHPDKKKRRDIPGRKGAEPSKASVFHCLPVYIPAELNRSVRLPGVLRYGPVHNTVSGLINAVLQALLTGQLSLTARHFPRELFVMYPYDSSFLCLRWKCSLIGASRSSWSKASSICPADSLLLAQETIRDMTS